MRILPMSYRNLQYYHNIQLMDGGCNVIREEHHPLEAKVEHESAISTVGAQRGNQNYSR